MSAWRLFEDVLADGVRGTRSKAGTFPELQLAATSVSPWTWNGAAGFLRTAAGAYQKPGCLAGNSGVERFDWNPLARRWTSVWTRMDVACKGVVPTVDGSLGIVFLNSLTSGAGHPVMGMDWLTGETVW